MLSTDLFISLANTFLHRTQVITIKLCLHPKTITLNQLVSFLAIKNAPRRFIWTKKFRDSHVRALSDILKALQA